MKFALIGKDISHSLSPELYKKIIGPHVQYDLLDFQNENELPSLKLLAQKYNGINITTPYKAHYLNEVILEDENLKQLGAINTIAFTKERFIATNTDVSAVQMILKELQMK